MKVEKVHDGIVQDGGIEKIEKAKILSQWMFVCSTIPSR